ncbi:RNA-directed DNA polymerase from mobile element jockey [Caerostris extrusa]|uniref:RNA-directed DNA polymerase from mobile element jockey n=1 Tax=Caerostris extrusa TaxID=172846 RepID=A0AAV4R0Y4_CAEEX|nr:RNA-directed DNA polymerase from mobile element jockey [Caerostris extrusa]
MELKLENTPPITFISTYVKPQNFSSSDLKILIESNRNTIIAGRLQRDSLFLEQHHKQLRGIRLNKFFKTRNDIKIIAPHSHTHISPQARYVNSIIDFALLRNIPYDTTTEVINELNSDHLPVIITLKLKSNLATSTQSKITNWHNYNHILQTPHFR